MAYDTILAERIGELLDERTGFTHKRMFGCMMWWLEGNSCCGVHENQLLIKVSPADYDKLLSEDGVETFGPQGKPMKGWITVEPELVDTREDLQKWMQPALEFAKSRPAK